MTLTFSYLDATLYETANGAIAFLKKERGLSGFKAEVEVDPRVEFRPTLTLVTRQHDIVCVEISDTAYPRRLDPFVLDCKTYFLPVKLYVAMPKAQKDPEYQANTARARTMGVGVILIDGAGGDLVYDALALSLTGCRAIPKVKFPPPYRPRLAGAETTYRAGSPDTGCLIIYKEIEHITREAAKKGLHQKVWANPPTLNLDKAPWRNILGEMIKHCDFKKANCPGLNTQLLQRILAVVDHRNAVAHNPKKLSERIKRDSQLRTRFEGAVDLLQDLVDATKRLRI